MDPGQRDRFITIQRAALVDDGYGQNPDWDNAAEVASGWARVRYGSGQERREAAQEQASQAATFEFEWNPTIAAVEVTDRLQFDNAGWDITSKALIGRNREVHLTAVRNA